MHLTVKVRPLGPLDGEPVRMSAPCCGSCYQRLRIIGDAALERVCSESGDETSQGVN